MKESDKKPNSERVTFTTKGDKSTGFQNVEIVVIPGKNGEPGTVVEVKPAPPKQ